MTEKTNRVQGMNKVEKEIKKLHDQVHTLRICNLITSVFYLVSLAILQVQYYQTCLHYRQIVDANEQILSVFQSYLELLGKVLPF